MPGVWLTIVQSVLLSSLSLSLWRVLGSHSALTISPCEWLSLLARRLPQPQPNPLLFIISAILVLTRRHIFATQPAAAADDDECIKFVTNLIDASFHRRVFWAPPAPAATSAATPTQTCLIDLNATRPNLTISKCRTGCQCLYTWQNAQLVLLPPDGTSNASY